MVIVKIWGGLGNQLFQYSFGKYLSVKLSTPVKYDIQTTNSLNSFTQRNFVLSAFNLDVEAASDSNQVQETNCRIELETSTVAVFAQFLDYLYGRSLDKDAPGRVDPYHSHY